MIISLNWLKKFVDIDISVNELTDLINTRLVEIDSVTDIGKKYENVLVVKVISAQAVEGSDHLSLLKIDDGGKASDIERDENGLVQVVCGAPNVAAGQMVVWLPPKSVVPQTFNDPEPFVLDTRKLRGVISNGMIASARELDLFDDHTGILVVDNDLVAGSSFAEVYELDDYLLNIENKSLTHRPDCFSIIGIAREVAAITGKPFKTPEYLMDLEPDFFNNNDINLNVFIDNPELSDRYQAIVMTGVDSKRQSALKIQTYLARVGVRPINAIVDVTNYYMIVAGQPLHAFDYDKVLSVSDGKAEVHVRAGREGEELELLDGRTIKLTTDDIVIAAGDTAIALAGAMGGASTEIDENTKNIIIESATFNLYKLRSTQMRHGIFSEAITRFTKGLPAALTAPILAAAVHQTSIWAGGKTASLMAEAYPGKKQPIEIKITFDEINTILGSEFSNDQIINTLKNAEFNVDNDNDSINVTVPYWRNDIHIAEDIVEEIGRINGFDNIKPTLPVRDFRAITPNDFDIFRTTLRKVLVRAGANEILTYSFIHGNVLQKADQKPENSYRLINSISPDLQYFRQTLTPSLLGLIHPNIKQGYDEFALFEINKCHYKPDGKTDENVPVESERIALVYADKNNQTGAAYYRAKKLLEYICSSLNLNLEYKVIENNSDNPVLAPFEYRRSAELIDVRTGVSVGFVGEYKKSVIKEFKLPEYVAGFELDTRLLFDATKSVGKIYSPLSRYPAIERDICFKVDQSILCSQIINAVNNKLSELDLKTSVQIIDIYQPEIGDTKNITIRIKLISYNKTLTGEEANRIVNSITDSVISQTNAIVV